MSLWGDTGVLDGEQGGRKGRPIGQGQALLFPGPPRHSPDLEEEIICGNEGWGCGGAESPRPGHTGAQWHSAGQPGRLIWGRRRLVSRSPVCIPTSPPSSLALCLAPSLGQGQSHTSQL